MFLRIFRIAMARIAVEFNDWPSLCPIYLTCVKFPTMENCFRVFIPTRTTVRSVFLCVSVLPCVGNGKALGQFPPPRNPTSCLPTRFRIPDKVRTCDTSFYSDIQILLKLMVTFVL